MELTEELKAKIDAMSYMEMLGQWRFAEVGSPWFQGEVGKYFSDSMFGKRDADPEAAVAASKAIGWGR